MTTIWSYSVYMIYLCSNFIQLIRKIILLSHRVAPRGIVASFWLDTGHSQRLHLEWKEEKPDGSIFGSIRVQRASHSAELTGQKVAALTGRTLTPNWRWSQTYRRLHDLCAYWIKPRGETKKKTPEFNQPISHCMHSGYKSGCSYTWKRKKTMPTQN